jgi:membrane protein
MMLQPQNEYILKIFDFFRIKNQAFRRFVAILEIFSARIEKNHLYLVSAGIAFNILIYLIPLFLVAIYVVNILFRADFLVAQLQQIAGKFLPPGDTATAILDSTIREINVIAAHSKTAGWIGIISLLWISSTLFSSLRSGLNNIFRIETKQIFIFYRLKDILITVIMAFLILISSYLFPMMSIAQSMIFSLIPDQIAKMELNTIIPPTVQWLTSWITVTIISLTTYFIIFYLIFRFIPNKKLPLYIRIQSTTFCVVFIEFSRHLFAWYLSTVSSYGKLYGTYAIIVSVAVWIYYMTLLILISAELSKLMFELRAEDKDISL